MTILQIGVYKGDCTEFLLENLKVKEIVDVDTWQGSMEDQDLKLRFKSIEEIYDAKFAGNKRVKKMKMSSDTFFAETLLEEYFDFIYIDGAHTSPQVLKDGINSFEKCKIGGILAFDDYEWPRYQGTLSNPKMGIDCWMSLYNGYFDLILANYQIWVKKLRNFNL